MLRRWLTFAIPLTLKVIIAQDIFPDVKKLLSTSEKRFPANFGVAEAFNITAGATLVSLCPFAIEKDHDDMRIPQDIYNVVCLRKPPNNHCGASRFFFCEWGSLCVTHLQMRVLAYVSLPITRAMYNYMPTFKLNATSKPNDEIFPQPQLPYIQKIGCGCRYRPPASQVRVYINWHHRVNTCGIGNPEV